MLRISLEPRKMGGYPSYFTDQSSLGIGTNYSVHLRGYEPWAVRTPHRGTCAWQSGVCAGAACGGGALSTPPPWTRSRLRRIRMSTLPLRTPRRSRAEGATRRHHEKAQPGRDHQMASPTMATSRDTRRGHQKGPPEKGHGKGPAEGTTSCCPPSAPPPPAFSSGES